MNYFSVINRKACQYDYDDTRGRLTSIHSELFDEILTYTSKSFDGSGYYNGCIASDSFAYPTDSNMLNYCVKYRYNTLGELVIGDIDKSNYNSYDLGINSSSTADPITYDQNGNLLRVNRHGDISNYIYSSGSNKVLGKNGINNQYSYDLNANIIRSTPQSDTSITYDPFTQMTMKIITPNKMVSFEYDGRKERVLKKVTQGSVTSTLYLRGMSDYPLLEKTSSGTSCWYIYGPTGLIARIDNDNYYYNYYYIFKDHLGSTRAIMNGSDGSGVEFYAYDAWGKVIDSRVSPNIRYKFTGQEYDEETDLHNYRARMYDQSLGRFYATDPAQSTFTPYGYARNNPLSFVDPSGMMDWQSYLFWTAYNTGMLHDNRTFLGEHRPHVVVDGLEIEDPVLANSYLYQLNNGNGIESYYWQEGSRVIASCKWIKYIPTPYNPQGGGSGSSDTKGLIVLNPVYIYANVETCWLWVSNKGVADPYSYNLTESDLKNLNFPQGITAADMANLFNSASTVTAIGTGAALLSTEVTGPYGIATAGGLSYATTALTIAGTICMIYDRSQGGTTFSQDDIVVSGLSAASGSIPALFGISKTNQIIIGMGGFFFQIGYKSGKGR